jgi:transposase-like protein
MKCPACGSTRVYPSRLRSALERMRQRVTDKQPYRCHKCGWRRWRDIGTRIEGPDAGPADLRTGRRAAPVSQKDLDQLDPTPPRT